MQGRLKRGILYDNGYDGNPRIGDYMPIIVIICLNTIYRLIVIQKMTNPYSN